MSIDVFTGPIAAALEALPDLLEDYQTLIGAVLGFPSIIYTLNKNNKNQLKLQANQKAHDLKLRANQVANDRRSLRAALKSELTSVREAYVGNIANYNEEGQAGSSIHQNSAFHVVFDSHVEKLCLLSEAEIDAVIKAYRLISEVPYKLRLLVGFDNQGVVTDDYIVLNQDATGIAAGLLEVILAEINTAIQELERHLNPPS
ncbi:MAG: hypothetical protein N0E55_09665 [Candidatus Thiodiazotropha taylori]|nr:hypothetical protein [Candidatus Thiodiazotropha taylori]MCW4252957.1 hypothetical protein [Candidatus Thiodiazotropha taylori]